MNKKVIYTSIFGNYDTIREHLYVPEGYDLVLFTDSDIKSTQWDVRKQIPLYEDNARNAKRYKILPHRFLSDYDTSIYIDGSFVIKDDINILINKYLSTADAAFFDHNQQEEYDRRNCIYKEAAAILNFGAINMQRKPSRGKLNYKDDPDIIQNQIQRYHSEGFPEELGLVIGGIILRNHNSLECIKTMEDWWSEIKYNSKRDQLSFNYIAWKNNFKFNYIPGKTRDIKYVDYIKHSNKQ